jgi:hypothetical protein
MKKLSWQMEIVLVISVFISVFTWQWTNILWLQNFSVTMFENKELFVWQSGISFPVVTVCVVLCLLDLAMPTADICHNLYCTLMITKLIVCSVLYMMLFVLTNSNALLSTMNQSRFLIISFFKCWFVYHWSQ